MLFKVHRQQSIELSLESSFELLKCSRANLPNVNLGYSK